MKPLLTHEMRAAIGTCESFGPFELSRREIVKYAVATEQRLERFRSGDEAPPLFLLGLLRPILPADELEEDGLAADPLLPELPLSRVMAGGTKMRLYKPVGAGDRLQATRALVDLREKEGRSGPLIFVDYELRVTDDAGELVALETQTRILR